MRHRVHGIENQVTDGPRIIVVNHQSALDIPALIPVWPRRSTFVAKRSIATYASFGLLVWFLKAILIDRSNRDDSIHKLRNAAKIVKEHQVSVIIFPEGTRGDGKSGLLPFKKGAFYLAVEAQVPVQPVVIASYSGFDISNRVARGVSTIGMVASDVAPLADRVQKKMSDVFMCEMCAFFSDFVFSIKIPDIIRDDGVLLHGSKILCWTVFKPDAYSRACFGIALIH
ncbi:1-acyl-sn-glycerol-3-phosphate acyltransferase alpha [Echinococcus granulosus]|uniref:1-acyl-sn-glycerol-3-phosphate acyltransferase n=1 Tax=Echinococcus granulosus TaxID=6210 RepID=W6UQ56_ECHGR|nr:1-acyl-sn-glycerol-3-phosphate acyltransferase alpha [Echinococcus granulosus]EUB63373.1 1-acyl-sn-glycerol-3-phosphate acyltransferase alpha [Echinococcus granulosus]